MKELAVKEEKKKIKFNFADYKSIIYTIVFYLCGLAVGADFYKIANNDTLNNVLSPKQLSFISLFTSNLCLYFSLFLIVVFLGFCLIAYPFINIIPLIVGIYTGLKIGYFFINYNAKGVGYSLIMIIPFSALFMCVIAFSIKLSIQLSKSLIDITKNRGDAQKIEVKPYLKKYLILGLCIIASALINAGLTTLLFNVVTI